MPGSPPSVRRAGTVLGTERLFAARAQPFTTIATTPVHKSADITDGLSHRLLLKDATAALTSAAGAMRLEGTPWRKKPSGFRAPS